MSEQGPAGLTSYEYDAAGNLARKRAPGADPVEYAWTVENRLSAVRRGGRVLMAATYGGDGSKVLQSTLYHTDEVGRSAIAALLAELALLGPHGARDVLPGTGLPAPPGAAGMLAQAGVEPAELLAMASGAPRLPLSGYGAGGGGADASAGKRAAIPVETPYVQERWELVAYVNSTVVDEVAQPMARYSDVSGALVDVYGLSRLSTAGGAPDLPVAATYLDDGLGSVSAVLDSSGAVSASYSYSPWGGASGDAGELPAYGYNAEEATAAAGLQYLRARWYDPGSASFASIDTYLGSASDLKCE